MSFNKIVREGDNICPGAIKTYLTVYPQEEESIKFYTPFPYVRWEVVEKVKNEPQGQYWVSFTYTNTGTYQVGYECGETKYAMIYGVQQNGFYNWIQGEILDIVLTHESYEWGASYKLLIRNINNTEIKKQLVDSQSRIYSLASKSDCVYYEPAAAFPGSVIIDDIIPITGGYEYEFKVFDERGFVFSKTFETIPTIDEYCVFPREECPAGTCSLDCNPDYICCYGKDGKVKKLIYK